MTRFVLGDYFDPLKDRLHSSLIDAVSLRDIRQFADTIPGEVTAFFGFECPLSGLMRPADLLFCSTQREGHSAILAGNHRSVRLPESLLYLPAWRRVQEFCMAWESTESELYQQLLNVWLEFDIGQSAPPFEPSLFFGTPPESHSQPEVMNKLVAIALQNLAPEALQHKRGDTLRHVLACFTETGGHVFQVGAMLSRNIPAIRVCFRGVEVSQIVTTLQRSGWCGDAEALSRLISRYSVSSSRVDVDVDVGETIGEKIGLECSFGQDQRTLVRMRNFLQTMIVEGLISKNTADALIRFNGLEHQDANPVRWCEHLQRLAALQGRDVINLLACWLHHVKLVYQDGDPLSAKAYLAVQADRMKRSELRNRLSALESS